MSKKKSYKEYIRKAIFKKSMMALVITMALIYTTVFVLYYFNSINDSVKDNIAKSDELTNVIEISERFLLDTDFHFEHKGDKIELTSRYSIYEEFYNLFSIVKLKPKLYVFQEDNENLLNKYDEIPDYIKVYDKNWGVYRELQEDNEIVISVAVDNNSNEKSRYLLINMALEVEDEEIGYVVLSFSEKEISKIFEKYTTKTTITDIKGNFLYNQIGFNNKFYNRISDEYFLQDGVVTVGKNKYYVEYVVLEDYGLVLYSGKSLESVFELLLGLVAVFFVVLLILCLSLYLGTKSIAKIGTEHLDELTSAFIKAKNGDLEIYKFENSYEEFELIEKSYNTMLISLKKQIERNKEISYILANTTIRDLEAQFEPHFLFNTLESIKVMCKLDPQIAEKMILKLSKILRYSLNYRFEDVSLEQDIENIENYLAILKFRFNKRFQYEINIDDNTKKCLIPRLVVQPIIENSAKYGMGENDILHISIKAYEENGKLFIICVDDGVGIDEEKLLVIKEMISKGQNTSPHFGIYNVHRMLALKYGKEYGLEINSEKNVKTEVRISLPYIDGSNENV